MAEATDDFGNYSSGLDSPAAHDVDVTPSDSADMPHASRALYITTGGTIRYTTVGGNTVTRTVPDNFILPLRVKRVWATGTSAADICCWY